MQKLKRISFYVWLVCITLFIGSILYNILFEGGQEATDVMLWFLFFVAAGWILSSLTFLTLDVTYNFKNKTANLVSTNSPKRSINISIDNLMKVATILCILTVSVSVLIYALKPSKIARSTFEVCYQECQKLGRPPKHGVCDEGYSWGTRESDKGAWCYVSAGYCLNTCRGN